MKGTLVVYDSETGGLHERTPTIQIAAVALRDWQEIDAFEAKIRFDVRECEAEALRINHYDPERWRDALPESAALAKLCDFFRRHATVERISKGGKPYSVAALAGYNLVSFDVPRLRQMAARHGDVFLPCQWWWPLDVYQRALWHFAELDLEAPANYQLPTLAAHFGLDAGGAHDALADCRLTAQLAQKLVTWAGMPRDDSQNERRF